MGPARFDPVRRVRHERCVFSMDGGTIGSYASSRCLICVNATHDKLASALARKWISFASRLALLPFHCSDLHVLNIVRPEKEQRTFFLGHFFIFFLFQIRESVEKLGTHHVLVRGRQLRKDPVAQRTGSKMGIDFAYRPFVGVPLDGPGYLSPSIEAIAEAE
jgi:hypothetical protein